MSDMAHFRGRRAVNRAVSHCTTMGYSTTRWLRKRQTIVNLVDTLFGQTSHPGSCYGCLSPAEGNRIESNPAEIPLALRMPIECISDNVTPRRLDRPALWRCPRQPPARQRPPPDAKSTDAQCSCSLPLCEKTISLPRLC
jgi:hypothetical protein